MIIPIYINTTQILDTYETMSQDGVSYLCDRIAKSLANNYANKLRQEANSTLHQTRNVYIRNIHVIDSGKMRGTVILDYSKSPLVRMIEEGITPFDLKFGMLNSQKAKVSAKGGKYITIPFRIGTPNIAGDSDVFSNIMPEEVYSKIKTKRFSIDVAGYGKRSKGLTNDELPVQYQKKETRGEIKDGAGKTLFPAYTHKNPIYEGAFKQKDSVTNQNTYHSFRRVSEQLISPEGKTTGSDPNSWIHSGIEKYNLVQKALNKFNTGNEVEIALNRELQDLGFI